MKNLVFILIALFIFTQNLLALDISPTWSPVPENKVVIHPNFQNGKIRIDVDGDDNTNSGTKFYRFKMDD